MSLVVVVVAAAAILADVVLAAALVLVAVPLVVWMAGRPQRAVLVLAALLPFDGLLLLVDVPPVVGAWKEAIVVLAIVAAAVRARQSGIVPSVPSWVVPLGAFLAVALVSAAFVGPVQAAVGIKVTFFGMLMAGLVWLQPLTSKDRDRLVTVLAVVGALVAVVGIVQQLVGPERLNDLGYAYNSTIRFTGDRMRSWATFNQPFPYAFFLMLVILVTGTVALDRPDRQRNLLVLFAMPLYVIGLATAVVRAAWIGLVVGLIYLAVVRFRRLLGLVPVAAALVLVALILGAGGFFLSPSATERVDRWTTVPAVVAEQPLGVGIGSAGAAGTQAEALAGGTATSNPDRIGPSRVVFQPDNSYLKVMYELGIPGLMAFTLLLLSLGLHLTRQQQDDELGTFATGATAFLLAGVVASLAATFFEIFPLDYLFWLVVGVASWNGLGSRQAPTGTR